MKKIGILGGTFNPVHNAHVAIAKSACEQFGLEKVMFLPNNIPPHKKTSDSVAAKLRIKMVEAAIKGDKNFFISTYETDKGGCSYTVETMKYFSEIYEDIYFIIGGDSLRDFPKWYKPDEILKMCTLIAYPRENLDFELHADTLRKMYGARILKLSAPEIDISSSEIRQRIKSGESISHLVPEEVYKIIRENKLYE